MSPVAMEWTYRQLLPSALFHHIYMQYLKKTFMLLSSWETERDAKSWVLDFGLKAFSAHGINDDIFLAPIKTWNIINVLLKTDNRSGCLKHFNRDNNAVCLHALMLSPCDIKRSSALARPLGGLIMREAFRAFISVLPRRYMLFSSVPGKEI